MTPNIPGYRISKKIGEGGTSTVYRALHEKSRNHVAIKIMEPELLRDPANLRRFLRQVKIAKKLHHNNIVKTYGIDRHGHYHYIVMELLGESLKDRLNRRGKLKEGEALEIVRRIAGALAYAHSKGVVHWDIKPGNILFRHDGNPVIVDFGLAFCRDVKASLTSQGTLAGTLHYMSPEHCKGEKGEPAGDIYSLGVVLYELLTGTVPYDPANFQELIYIQLSNPLPRLPYPLDRCQPLIDKMMVIDKRKRFRSGKKVIQLIDQLNGGKNPPESTFWEKLKESKIWGIPTLVLAPIAALIIVLGLLVYNVISNPGKMDTVTTAKPSSLTTFNPTTKQSTNANTPPIPTDQYSEEQKPPENKQPEPTDQTTTNRQTSTQPSSSTMQTANNSIKPVTPGQLSNTQPTPVKTVETPIVSLNQLDEDIRANIESKFKQINVRIDGVESVTKTGNYQVVIALDSSGVVKSINIPGIEVEPKEISAEFKSLLGQKIRGMNFLSPTINGKPVNVKIGIIFNKVAKFSGSIILVR